MGFKDLFKSNFTRIAENTTKYYLELKNNYGNRFSDETSLLTTAGVLDAQNYIFRKKQQISIEQIMDMAEKAASGKQGILLNRLLSKIGLREKLELGAYIQSLFSTEPLAYFIFTLEVEMFKVDTPFLGESDITMACLRKLGNIKKAIEKTKGKYRGKDLLAKATAKFMESHEFQPIRKELGIIG